MKNFKALRLDQARQVADAGQVFETLKEAENRLLHYHGTMRWKTISGREYLYRRAGRKDTSVGPRSPRTEAEKVAFDEGKAKALELRDGVRWRLEEMAPVNRALRLGRVPIIAARIARRLSAVRLLGASVSIVGTNSLYCYEAMAGGHFSTDLASTEDIDLLYDSRRRLQIVSEDLTAFGLLGLLQEVDSSFQKLPNGFQVVNKDAYLVDLIAPMPKDVLRSKPQTVSPAAGDLVAAEIQGLQWLVNAPKVAAMAIDARGLPVALSCVDPRYYAIHKLWLSGLDDRDPPKRLRDMAQASAVARLVVEHLPSLRLDDRALEALPKRLRVQAADLFNLAPEEKPEW